MTPENDDALIRGGAIGTISTTRLNYEELGAQ